MDEVARHASAEDAYVVIDGCVYDVTSLLAHHPGGAGVLAAHAGRDVTREFAYLRHSEQARLLLPGLCVGRLKDGGGALPPLPLPPAPAPRREGGRRVLVIGAGICGVVTAAYLAERGHAVTVVDAAPLPGGTALKSTAILFVGPAIETLSTRRGVSLSEWSGDAAFEMMAGLGARLGGRDVGWRERGTLGVITDAATMANVTAKFAPGGPLHGRGGELVSAARALELEPSLSPAAVLGATWHARGATVDPYLVCAGYAGLAADAGAAFAYGRRVTALARRPGGGFTAVVERAEPPGLGASAAAAGSTAGTDPVALDADDVVIATGWLCRPLAALLGHTVAVDGIHGQLFTASGQLAPLRTNLYSWEGPAYWNAHPEARQATLEPEPPHRRLTRHFYAVAAGNGVLKIGGDRLRLPLGAAADRPLIAAGIADTVATARALLPGLAGCEVTGAWSGTMPFTPGQTPILGALERGLWVAAGAPFTKGPAYGLLLADAIDGRAPPGSEAARLLAECDPHKPSRRPPQQQGGGGGGSAPTHPAQAPPPQTQAVSQQPPQHR